MEEKKHISINNIAICIIFVSAICLLSTYTSHLLSKSVDCSINIVLSIMVYIVYSIFFYNIFKRKYKDKKLDYFAILSISNYVAYIIIFAFNIAVYDTDIYQYLHIVLMNLGT